MIDESKRARFMANNFLEAGYNSLAVTSVFPNHFASDLLTDERTRTFKFGGRFTIDATNNKITVNGVTYTLTNAEYTSAALLSAHITTQIAAQTVVCSWDETTGWFYFTKATSFTMNCTTTTNAVWTTIGYLTSADKASGAISGGHAVYPDNPRFHYPNEKITIDMGYNAEVGFIGLIGDLTRELKIPEGGVITLKGNTVNDFAAPLFTKVLTWGKRGVFAFLDDIAGSDAWRYFELTIEAVEGPFLSEIGYFYLGDYQTFDDRNISVGFTEKWMNTSSHSKSDDGQKFYNLKTMYRQFNGLNTALVSPEQVNFINRIYALKETAAPFFVSLDPKVLISEYLDDKTAFCRFSSEPESKQVIFNKYNLSFELEEAL